MISLWFTPRTKWFFYSLPWEHCNESPPASADAGGRDWPGGTRQRSKNLRSEEEGKTERCSVRERFREWVTHLTTMGEGHSCTETEIVRLGSVNLLLFFRHFRSPSPVQVEWKKKINKFSRTLTPHFRTLFMFHHHEFRECTYKFNIAIFDETKTLSEFLPSPKQMQNGLNMMSLGLK